jgi:single-stranded DNA-specific DHH superfamily exonuclease
MILAHEDLLERYGGHKGAGGLTVKVEKLELL